MPGIASSIEFGDGLIVTDEGGGTIRVDVCVIATPVPKKILACWGGPLPASPQVSIVWRVPFDTDGSTFTFNLERAFARVETTQTSLIQIDAQSSPGGGTFTPSPITSMVIGIGNYETENTGFSVAVTSGMLLRLNFSALPGPQPNFAVELEGTQ